MSIRNCQELGPNIRKIASQLLKNQDLCKLLYYGNEDPLGSPFIQDTSILLNKQITLLPKYNPAEEDYSVVSIVVQNGHKITQNDEYRNFLIRFYIYVPISNWVIKDNNLRPFSIIGQIEKSLSGKNINGLGTLEAGDFYLNMITEQMTGYYIDFYLVGFR